MAEGWALHIMEIRQHIQAGCSFGPDDLAHAEWGSLALLEKVVADVLEERMKR
ncbi:MAG: hypothetical protein IH975_07895 [Nitrospinae bacterium]|nr:hypothetical protein [Nitrospinota bacterium]